MGHYQRDLVSAQPFDRGAGEGVGAFVLRVAGVALGYRCPASPRHALLAESLGKPSLWVIISAPWYQLATFAFSAPTEAKL